MITSLLKLEWFNRAGGGGKTERKYLDYLIDGTQLRELLGCEQLDVISRLGWGKPEENNKALDKLILQDKPDGPNSRFMLYVCAECGDIGCGAITAVIEESSDCFVWRDFAYENNYDEGKRKLNEFERFGPFYFEKSNYTKELNRARLRVQ